MPEAINIYISSKDGLPRKFDTPTGTEWKRDELQQIQWGRRRDDEGNV